MISCPLCAKMFQNQGMLDRHVFSHTKEKPHKCLICSKTFGRVENLKQHIKSVHDGVKTITNKNSHCPTCSFKCANKAQLKIHLRKHSTELPFSCNIPQCGFKTKYKNNLSIHVNGFHSDERPHKCPSEGCNYKAKTAKGLKQHLNTHSKEKPFACTVTGCNFTCKRNEYLRVHTVKAHSNDKPFKCSTCDFRGNTKSALIWHQQRKHKTAQRFQCSAPNCSYGNVDRSQLALHVDRKHRKKDVRCTAPGCNFRCGSITLLKIHLKEHEKPILKCPGYSCNFTTKLKGNLLTHISRHHGELQSAAGVVGSKKLDLEVAETDAVEILHCTFPDCGYQTKFLHEYDRHKITHNGDGKAQHVCSFCFSRFSHLSVLRVHIQRHIREKPYNCSFCKYAAVYASHLKSHAGKIHQIYGISRGTENEVRNCRTCYKIIGSYSEFVLHSMTHLKTVVVLEKLKLQIL